MGKITSGKRYKSCFDRGGKEENFLKEVSREAILGKAEFAGRIKGLLKGEEIGQDGVYFTFQRAVAQILMPQQVYP